MKMRKETIQNWVSLKPTKQAFNALMPALCQRVLCRWHSARARSRP